MYYESITLSDLSFRTINFQPACKRVNGWLIWLKMLFYLFCAWASSTPFQKAIRNLASGVWVWEGLSGGVGPGSSSSDAANWLPSRFSLSVEKRRRYGWLRMVFPGARLFRAPIWRSSGGWRHARGRQYYCGEPGSALSGGYAPDSTKAEGSSIVDESGEGWTPLCARITGLNREVSEGKADVWPRSYFFLRGPQGAANGQDSWGFFRDAQGFGRLDAGSRAGSTSSRPPPPGPRSVFQFPYFCTMCGVEKLGFFVDQNWLDVICPVCCWERLSWVGDSNPSRSRLLSIIWSKEVWWTVLMLVGAIACRAA